MRAAWSYINMPKNAAKYADKARAVKRKIIAAWKQKIDAAGPPSAEKAALAKNTGFYIAADVVRLVGELAYLSELQKEEEAQEGDTDAAAVCDALDRAITAVGNVAMAMLDEELGELPGNEDDEAEAAMAQGADAMKALKKKMHAGRVQAMHDCSVEMGAACAPMTDCNKATTTATPAVEEEGMKPEDVKELAKAVHAELGFEQPDGALAKAIGAAMAPKLDELAKATTAKLDEIAARVKVLEEKPEPPKGALLALAKAQDGAAAEALEQSALKKLAETNPLEFMKLTQGMPGMAHHVSPSGVRELAAR